MGLRPARLRRSSGILLSLAVAGCAGPDADQAPAGREAEVAQPAPEAEEPQPPGPEEIARLAPQGQVLFTDKGCIGCHAIDSDMPMSGPDLDDVTDRRSYAWITAMLMRPDSMTANDPVARELLARHMTQMPNLALTEEEARALFAYLHSVDEN